MINLSKGGRVNLSKDDNGNKLSKVFFGANWGAIKSVASWVSVEVLRL